ncbi:MAG TPA: cell division topological specificity factor MinE [Stellaceae bacterium]
MRVLDYLLAKKSAESAGVAKERLHLVLEQERAMRDAPQFLPKLQHDLLGIVGRYIEIGDDSLRIVVEREGGTPRLGISVELESSRFKPCEAPKRTARIERKARRLRQAAS